MRGVISGMSAVTEVPPVPPEVPRRLHLPAGRIAGLILLILLPLAALTGLTDRQGELSRSVTGMDVTLSWPAVNRLYRPGLLELTVTGTGPDSLQDVTVALPLDWLAQYGDLSPVPAAESVEDGQLLVRLGEVPAGETRSLRLELRGTSGSFSRTLLRVRHAEGEEQFNISSLVLP